MQTQPINPAHFPVVFTFKEGTEIDELIHWYRDNLEIIEKKLLEKGAILFQGINIDTLAKFEQVIDSISGKFLDYVDGNSPRTKLSSKVYTSTEYDPKFPITLHNELSYSAKWPSKLFFCCIIPSQTGGETPLADSRKILQNMDADLVERIRTKEIKYIRNLHGGEGFGPSWQDTFETSSRTEVEGFCRESLTDFIWKKDGGLRLIQNRKGIIQHPISGESVWFSQIDQFHPSHLLEEIYETLMLIYDGDEEELPMFVTLGDGSKFTEEDIREIKKTVDEQTIVRPWSKGDLLLVDNVLVCHGRMPYTGERRVLVSMS